MIGLPFIAAIGIGLTILGTGAQVAGSMQATRASKRAEDLRERQMNLDAARQRRQIIRESIMARSTSVSNATSQGAQDSSGLSGAIAQVSGDRARGIQYTGQSQSIGAGIFQANRQIAGGQGLSSIGSGISSLGSMFMSNAPTLSRLGQYYTQRPGGMQW